uniref:MAM domain-containing protein n=1 Tax=Setaria digitata TaxID=48799 RepID=A0A915Q099_9BILA
MSLIVAFMALTSPVAYGCTPFDYDTVARNVGLRSRYALGENTLKSQPISISNAIENRPIDTTSDLFCYDFDLSCRWYNVDSLLMNDDLNWFRGTGYLDRNRLQVSTGTYTTPDGAYAIVATDRINPPNSKAILISDVISCQLGPGELRFMYWISPEVRLKVCLKRISKPYPNFDFCSSSIGGGSPGPAHISIADLGNQPFQILIQADNFIFHSANLEGGFAIIDDLEYYGDLCSVAATPPSEQDLIISQTLYNENEWMEESGVKNTLPVYKPVCDVLQCTFDEQVDQCGIDTSDSPWSIMHVSNDEIKMESNVSNMLSDSDGSFAYIKGPVEKARIHTAPFQSNTDFNFLFAYYKTSTNSKLRVIVKMADKPTEKTVSTAPTYKKQNKRWRRELILLQRGIYDHVAIEVQNLDDDEYIGIDEFLVLDSQKRPICPQHFAS